jgi:hypothetical protein
MNVDVVHGRKRLVTSSSLVCTFGFSDASVEPEYEDTINGKA